MFETTEFKKQAAELTDQELVDLLAICGMLHDEMFIQILLDEIKSRNLRKTGHDNLEL